MLRAASDFGGARIGNVPEGAALDVIYEYDLWVLVDYQGTEGWVTSASICRLGGDGGIQLLHARTENIRGKFRHHFGFFNAGDSIFAGRIRLDLYSGKQVISSEEYDFSLDYIPGATGRAFHVDTDLEMTGYRFEVTNDSAMPVLLP